MRAIKCCLISAILVLGHSAAADEQERRVALPAIELTGTLSVAAAIERRRSVRRFGTRALALGDIGQLLWAAQGITHRDGLRTAPSAGALYPLEIYVVTGNVDALPAGVYRYRPKRHDLVQVASGDLRRRLAVAALDQIWVRRGTAVIVIAGVYERSAAKYGRRAERYTHMEVGHAAQNVYLQAESRGLGTVFVGAFHEADVGRILDLPGDHRPLGLMPVGHKR